MACWMSALQRLGDGSSTPSRRRHPALVLLAIWLIPMALWGGGLLLSELAQLQAHTPASDETIHPGARQIDGRQGVSVHIDLGERQELRSSSIGTVTALSLQTGSAPAAGTAVIAIDGVPRIAYSGATPFYRDLSYGDSGGDVATLISLLQRSGHLNAEAAYEPAFTWEIGSALREFQTSFGLERTGELVSDHFVYLPSEFGAVTEVQVSLGDQLAGDTVIATGSGPAYRAAVYAAGTSERPTGVDPGASLVLSAGDQHITLSTLNMQAEEATALLDTLRAWAAAGTVDIAVEDRAVVIDGVFLAYEHPIDVATVPYSAVLAGEAGATCVVEVRADGRERVTPVTVSPISSEPGVVGIDASFRNKTLLLDPAMSKASHICR